ncbi:MAG: arylesterase [Cephaloticoccus sp.]|nr:arylesterase [Cephaloticoccus sp.]MCF7758989.1 arylesterase [Cephaloticoccus sp.]
MNVRIIILACWSIALGAQAAEPKTIVCLGDSITAGYGLDNPAAEAYPALLQDKIDAHAMPYRVVNAGLSGDTTAGGLRRIDWLLRQRIDVLVLALGGNDGLRGIPPEVTRSNLAGIIDRVRVKYPDTRIILAGMQMPANLGESYTTRFRALFPAVARGKHCTLIPFLLEGVGGVPELNQADMIHPTAAGQVLIATTVWSILQAALPHP